MAGMLSSAVQWVVAQPPLDSALSSLATNPSVRELAALFGQYNVTPEHLLSLFLACLGAIFTFMMLIPKGRLALWSVWYFFVSGDKKTKKPDDFKFDLTGAKFMKIVFIRHGESEWNAVFNKGSKLFLPLRLARALVNEALMVFEQDSIFIDSPLSSIGIQQGLDLLTVLESKGALSSPLGSVRSLSEADAASLPVEKLNVEDIVSIIRGDVGESVVASSILRRAISTGLVCLSPRLLKTSAAKDKVILMTSLQEISRNVDTLALTPAHKIPVCPVAEGKLKHIGDIMSHFYRNRLDKKFNKGNKTIKTKAIKRQEDFTKWVFEKEEQTIGCIIVCGHSLWFREFFKSYLPKASKHVAKTSKMVNCGCVAFDIYKDSSNRMRIPPESVKEIYGGFEVKGVKLKNV